MSTLVVDPNLEAAVEEDGWGDEDEDEDAEEKKKAEQSGDGEAGWDVEDADLEIPDVGPSQKVVFSGNFVHAPAPGAPPTSTWVKNSQLAADHIMAGSFQSACRLLYDQVCYTKLFFALKV